MQRQQRLLELRSIQARWMHIKNRTNNGAEHEGMGEKSEDHVNSLLCE